MYCIYCIYCIHCIALHTFVWVYVCMWGSRFECFLFLATKGRTYFSGLTIDMGSARHDPNPRDPFLTHRQIRFIYCGDFPDLRTLFMPNPNQNSNLKFSADLSWFFMSSAKLKNTIISLHISTVPIHHRYSITMGQP